ncbi:MAG: hypothetical protein IPM29_00250 [Planctomycetes bacterium]|nr:hypothetical protein [Planctomycetota bacterium]
MSYEVYRLVHFVALALLFLSIGGQVFAPSGDKLPRAATITHGIALVLVLLGGFGMLARRSGSQAYEISQPWVLAKLGVWLTLALAPVLIKRAGLRGVLGALVFAALIGVAAYSVQARWLW